MFFVTRAYRWLHDVVSQATGLGITTNIIDCYAALLRMWQPGDRIFLFGFSRGAYTVRCLASVLSFCGIPTTMADGTTPLFRDVKSTRKIAKEAVKQVGFLIILLPFAYFFDRRYTHHDRRIKKDRRAEELQRNN